MSIFDRRHTGIIARGLVLAAAGVSVAACSSSVDRFAGYPPVNTASVPKQDSVTREKLAGAPKQGAVRPSWQQSPRKYASNSSSYTRQARTYTPPAPSYKRTPANGSVTVRSGQTMYSLARANHMSVQQLASANSIPYPYTLKVGQRLKVPGVASPTSPAPSFVPRKTTSAYRAASAPAEPRKNFTAAGSHRVEPGETLFSLGRKYNKNPYDIARYNNLAAPYGLNAGQVVKIPGSGATYAARTAPAVGRQPTTNVPFARKSNQIARKNTDRIAPAPVPKVAKSPDIQPATPTMRTASGSTFRWPVKGRVISSFGKKPNGLRNEGINIAVPEGTSVRSAEAGIVAYAGNELKGYGNLVLVRHKNGWVTAYAHNKQLFVKRGDTVKRGTVIAKAGQTGSVKSPQLHFEVRKGSSAVDPMKYLTSRTAGL